MIEISERLDVVLEAVRSQVIEDEARRMGNRGFDRLVSLVYELSGGKLGYSWSGNKFIEVKPVRAEEVIDD